MKEKIKDIIMYTTLITVLLGIVYGWVSLATKDFKEFLSIVGVSFVLYLVGWSAFRFGYKNKL